MGESLSNPSASRFFGVEAGVEGVDEVSAEVSADVSVDVSDVASAVLSSESSGVSASSVPGTGVGDGVGVPRATYTSIWDWRGTIAASIASISFFIFSTVYAAALTVASRDTCFADSSSIIFLFSASTEDLF